MLQHRGIISSARANLALRKALESLPDYEQTLAGLERVRTFIGSKADSDGAERPVDLVDEVVEAATSGGPAPADLAARAYAASQVEPRNKARLHVLDEATSRLEIQLDSIVTRGSDQLFTALHGQLENVVVKFGEIAPQLGDVSTAEAAITAGKVEQWRQAQDLGKIYDAIRSAQSRLMQTFAAGERTAAGLHDRIANVDQVFPQWLPWIRTGTLINPRSRQVTRLTPPWPNDGGVAYLRWAQEAGATLWVPTPDRLARYVQQSTADAQDKFYGPPRTLEQRTTREPDDAGQLVPTDSAAAPR